MENSSKKANHFVATFIPTKGDSTGTIIRKCVFILSVIVVIVCLVLILTQTSAEQEDRDMNQSLDEIKQLNASGQFSIPQDEVDDVKDEVPEILDKFVELYAENKDLVGWITVGDVIDYPVLMNPDDNEFYLYRNFHGEDSVSGSIFCDNHVQPIADADNLVIYGHNMLSGEYFAKLTYYNPYSTLANGTIDYYKSFPTIQFDTLYEEGTYKIFAGMYINVADEDGYPYPYFKKRQFNNKTQFMDFIGNIMDRSTFYTDVDLEYGDEIITLSTCYYYPLGKDVDCRFALFARKLREGESADVDVSAAYINPNPLYFDTYYARVGGEWKGRTWDTSLVKDFDDFEVDSLDEIEP